MSPSPISDSVIIKNTQVWIEKAVIGLNLCPFAKAAHAAKQIRYVVSHALTAEELLTELMEEMKTLAATDRALIETTLLIHPFVLTDFLDYNEFTEVADAALVDLNLEEVLSVACFHPDFQFAGTKAEDITNFTNRSPYPLFQLLREASIELALESSSEASDIAERNIQTLQDLGLEGWKKLGIKNGVSED